MSDVRLYPIRKNGYTGCPVECRNGSACAPHIWDTLGKKYLPGDLSPSTNRDRCLWNLVVPGTKLEANDVWVLAFTFDNMWCRRENIPHLLRALTEFWVLNQTFADNGDQVDDTIDRVIAQLGTWSLDHTLLGVGLEMYGGLHGWKNGRKRFNFKVDHSRQGRPVREVGDLVAATLAPPVQSLPETP